MNSKVLTHDNFYMSEKQFFDSISLRYGVLIKRKVTDWHNEKQMFSQN